MPTSPLRPVSDIDISFARWLHAWPTRASSRRRRRYPWESLASLRWFQVITCFNPLTYASEGLRAALDPGKPHIAGWICALALAGWCLLLGTIGMRGFLRRAVD